MIFFDKDGKEIDIKQFKKGSVVVARVTKPMEEGGFRNFCKINEWICRDFQRLDSHSFSVRTGWNLKTGIDAVALAAAGNGETVKERE